MRKTGNNIENANWHGLNLDNEGEWVDLDKLNYIRSNSGLYQIIYACYLLSGIPEDEAEELATKKLWRNLKELITPDEIRFATTDNPDGTMGGDLDPTTLQTWGKPE